MPHSAPPQTSTAPFRTDKGTGAAASPSRAWPGGTSSTGASVNNGHRFSRSGSAAFPVTIAASKVPWSNASASSAPGASCRCSSKPGSRAASSWNKGAKGPVGTSGARPIRSGEAVARRMPAACSFARSAAA